MHRILIIDDDPALLTFVRSALGDGDYEVDTATDAESAFAYLAVTLPDLLILDLNLPGGDGYKVLRAIRAKERYDLMLVVLLSARNDLETKVKGLDLGAVEYLVKPVHSDELSARVRALVRLKQRQDKILAEFRCLSELSLTDPLTNAYNRRALDRLLKARLAESDRYSIPISCVLFDIDHFKLVNDTYGHRTGDLVLQEISALTLSQCREEDALVRYGGEEFLIILFHTFREAAYVFAERLRERVASHPFVQEEQLLQITLSAGIATYPTDSSARGVEGMITLADQRLYAAKGAGRNRVVSED